MGTFLGHLVPGLSFTLLGLWHTLNTIKAYKLKGPANFSSNTWFPLITPLHCRKLKHLELYLILSFSILAVAAQAFDRPLASSLKLDGLEHATMFLHLAIYASIALAAELPSSPGALSALVGPLAASVFAQELFLLHFHSTDHAGLEGQYHWLLQLIAVVSFLATASTTGFPASFAAAIVRSASIVAQGVWFVIMGFVLWVPRLVPEGCYATKLEEMGVHGAVACATEDAGRRAAALANLQFSWLLAGLWIVTAGFCMVPGIKCMEYRELDSRGNVDMCHISSESHELKRAQQLI